jgi:hypothetical protein
MSSSHADAANTIDPLITELDRALATFDDSSSVLPSSQQKRFKSCCTTLQESNENLAKRSKSQRSIIMRVREVLADLYCTVSKEVFVLCAITVSNARLNKLAPSVRLPRIRRWWADQSPPQGLVDTTMAMCDANDIEAVIASYRQEQGVIRKITKPLHIK